MGINTVIPRSSIKPNWRKIPGSAFTYVEFNAVDSSLALSEDGVLSGAVTNTSIYDGTREGGLFYITLSDLCYWLGIPDGGLDVDGGWALLGRVTPLTAPGGNGPIVGHGLTNGVTSSNTMECHGLTRASAQWQVTRIGTTSNTPVSGSGDCSEVRSFMYLDDGSGASAIMAAIQGIGTATTGTTSAGGTFGATHYAIFVGVDATGGGTVDIGTHQFEVAAINLNRVLE